MATEDCKIYRTNLTYGSGGDYDETNNTDCDMPAGIWMSSGGHQWTVGGQCDSACCLNNGDCGNNGNVYCNAYNCNAGSMRGIEEAAHDQDCRTSDAATADGLSWGCSGFWDWNCSGNCASDNGLATHYDTPVGASQTSPALDAYASPFYCCTLNDQYEEYTQTGLAKSYWGPNPTDEGLFTSRAARFDGVDFIGMVTSPFTYQGYYYANGIPNSADGPTGDIGLACKKHGASDALHEGSLGHANSGGNWPFGSCTWDNCAGQQGGCSAPSPHTSFNGLNLHGWANLAQGAEFFPDDATRTLHNAVCINYYIDGCGVCRADNWTPPTGFNADGTVDCESIDDYCYTSSLICDTSDCPKRNECGECGSAYGGAPSASYCTDQCGSVNPNDCTYPGTDVTEWYIYNCTNNTDDYAEWNSSCFGCSMSEWGGTAGIIDDGSCDQDYTSVQPESILNQHGYHTDLVILPTIENQTYYVSRVGIDVITTLSTSGSSYTWGYSVDYGPGWHNSHANSGFIGSVGPGNSSGGYFAGWLSAKIYDSEVDMTDIYGGQYTEDVEDITNTQLVNNNTINIYEDYNDCAQQVIDDIDFNSSECDSVSGLCADIPTCSSTGDNLTIHAFQTPRDGTSGAHNNLRNFFFKVPYKYNSIDVKIYATLANNIDSYKNVAIFTKKATDSVGNYATVEVPSDWLTGVYRITTPQMVINEGNAAGSLQMHWNSFCLDSSVATEDGIGYYDIDEYIKGEVSGVERGWVYHDTGVLSGLSGGDEIYFSVVPTHCDIGSVQYPFKVWLGIEAIEGCTDASGLNYNKEANKDDGSCNYGCLPGIGAANGNLSPTYTINGGVSDASSFKPTNSNVDAQWILGGSDHPNSFLHHDSTDHSNQPCLESVNFNEQNDAGRRVKASADASCYDADWMRFRFLYIWLPRVSKTYIVSFYYKGFSGSSIRTDMRQVATDGNESDYNGTGAIYSTGNHGGALWANHQIKTGSNPRNIQGWYYFEAEFEVPTPNSTNAADFYHPITNEPGVRWTFSQYFGEVTGATLVDYRIREKDDNTTLPLLDCCYDGNSTSFCDCPEGNAPGTGCVKTMCNLNPGNNDFDGTFGYDWNVYSDSWECDGDDWTLCGAVWYLPNLNNSEVGVATNACGLHYDNVLADGYGGDNWIRFDDSFERYGNQDTGHCGYWSSASVCDIETGSDTGGDDFLDCLYGSPQNTFEVGGVVCGCSSTADGETIGSNDTDYRYTGRAPHYCCLDYTDSTQCDGNWQQETLSINPTPTSNTNSWLTYFYPGFTGYSNSIHCGNPSSCPASKTFEADSQIQWPGDTITESHTSPMGDQSQYNNLKISLASSIEKSEYISDLTDGGPGYPELGQNTDTYGCSEIDGYKKWDTTAGELTFNCNYNPSNTATLIDDGTCVGNNTKSNSVPEENEYGSNAFWNDYRLSGFGDTQGTNTHWKYGDISLPATAGIRPHPVYNKYFPCTCQPCETTDLLFDGNGYWQGYQAGYDFVNCPTKYFWDSDGDGIGCSSETGEAPEPRWLCPGDELLVPHADNSNYPGEVSKWTLPLFCIDNRCQMTNQQCDILQDCLESNENQCECPNTCDSNGAHPEQCECSCNCWVDSNETCTGDWDAADGFEISFPKIACNDGQGNSDCPCNNAYHMVDGEPSGDSIGNPSQILPTGEMSRFSCIDRCGECSMPGCTDDLTMNGCNNKEDACGQCQSTTTAGARCNGRKDNLYMSGVSVGEFYAGQTHPSGKGGCCRPENWDLRVNYYGEGGNDKWFENVNGAGGMDCHGVCFGNSVIDQCGNCTVEPGEDSATTSPISCLGNQHLDGTYLHFDTAGVEFYLSNQGQIQSPDVDTPTNNAGNNWSPSINCLTYEDQYEWDGTYCVYNWAVDSCGKCYGANADVHGCCIDDTGDTISNAVNIRENTTSTGWNTFPEMLFAFSEFEPPKEKLVHHYRFIEDYPYTEIAVYNGDPVYLFDEKGTHLLLSSYRSAGFATCTEVQYWNGGTWQTSNCGCDVAEGTNVECRSVDGDVDGFTSTNNFAYRVLCLAPDGNLYPQFLFLASSNCLYGGDCTIWPEYAVTATQACETAGTFHYSDDAPEHLNGQHSLEIRSSNLSYNSTDASGWGSQTEIDNLNLYTTDFRTLDLVEVGPTKYTQGNSWTISGWIKPNMQSMLPGGDNHVNDTQIFSLTGGKFIDCFALFNSERELCEWSTVVGNQMMFVFNGESGYGTDGVLSGNYGKVVLKFNRTTIAGTHTTNVNETIPSIDRIITDTPSIKWHHFSIVYHHNQDWVLLGDGSQNRKNFIEFYIDGAYQGGMTTDTFLFGKFNLFADGDGSELNQFPNMKIKDLKMHQGKVYPPIRHYKFNDAAASIGEDTSFYGTKDASLFGGATITNDGLVLDGAPSTSPGQFALINEPIPSSDTFTVMAWVKGRPDGGYSGNWNMISAYGESGSGQNQQFILGQTSGERITFLIKGPSGWIGPGYNTGLDCIEGTSYYTVPNANEWHHFTGTFDGNRIKLYDNGKEVNTCTLVTPVSMPENTGATTAIGARSYCINDTGTIVDQGQCSWFDGIIKDVRIYTTTLEQNQIKDIVNNDVNQLFDRTNFSNNNPEGINIVDQTSSLSYSWDYGTNKFIGSGTFDIGTEYKFIPPSLLGAAVGCTDSLACNYNISADINDGSCTYPEYPDCNCEGTEQYDCTGSCVNITDTANFGVNDECGVCDGDNSSCSGCMDINACNYDAAATIECEYGDESDTCCEYPEENFSCDNVCMNITDCAGVCNGNGVEDCSGNCNGDAELDDCNICNGGNYFDSSNQIIAGGSLPTGNCSCMNTDESTFIDCSGMCGSETSSYFSNFDSCGNCSRQNPNVTNYNEYLDDIFINENIRMAEVCTNILDGCSLVLVDNHLICYPENTELDRDASFPVPIWMFYNILNNHNFDNLDAENGIYTSGITQALCTSISDTCGAITGPEDTPLISQMGTLSCYLGWNGSQDDCGVCNGQIFDGCPAGDSIDCEPNQQLQDGNCYNIYDFNQSGTFDFSDLVFQMDYINYVNTGDSNFNTDESLFTDDTLVDIFTSGDNISNQLNIIDAVKMIKAMKDLGDI